MMTMGVAWCVGSDLHSLDELEAVHDGHVDVGDDDVEARRGELAQAVDAVVGFGHPQIFHAGEREDEQLPHHR